MPPKVLERRLDTSSWRKLERDLELNLGYMAREPAEEAFKFPRQVNYPKCCPNIKDDDVLHVNVCETQAGSDYVAFSKIVTALDDIAQRWKAGEVGSDDVLLAFTHEQFRLCVLFILDVRAFGKHKSSQLFCTLFFADVPMRTAQAVPPDMSGLQLKFCREAYVHPETELGIPLSRTGHGRLIVVDQQELAGILLEENLPEITIQRLHYHDESRDVLVVDGIDKTFEKVVCDCSARPVKRKQPNPPPDPGALDLIGDILKRPRGRDGSTLHAGAKAKAKARNTKPKDPSTVGSQRQQHLAAYGLTHADLIDEVEIAVSELDGLVPRHLQNDLQNLFGVLDPDEEDGDNEANDAEHDEEEDRDLENEQEEEDEDDVIRGGDPTPLDPGPPIEEPFPWNLLREGPKGYFQVKESFPYTQCGRLHQMPDERGLSWKMTCTNRDHHKCFCWVTVRSSIGDQTEESVQASLTHDLICWLAQGVVADCDVDTHLQQAQVLKRKYGMKVRDHIV